MLNKNRASVQHLRYLDFICQSVYRSSWAAGFGSGVVVDGCCWFLLAALRCCCESPAQRDTPGWHSPLWWSRGGRALHRGPGRRWWRWGSGEWSQLLVPGRRTKKQGRSQGGRSPPQVKGWRWQSECGSRRHQSRGYRTSSCSPDRSSWTRRSGWSGSRPPRAGCRSERESRTLRSWCYAAPAAERPCPPASRWSWCLRRLSCAVCLCSFCPPSWKRKSRMPLWPTWWRFLCPLRRCSRWRGRSSHSGLHGCRRPRCCCRCGALVFRV